MPADPQKVLADALELPENARADLAAELLRSLEDDDENLTFEEWQTAWGEEISRRLRDVREGRVQTVAGKDVFLAARERLAKR